MSRRNSYTTADYIPWKEAMSLVRRLYRDGDYRMSLMIGCGCFFGIRAGDLLALRWEQIHDRNELVIHEGKTGKRRVIAINRSFQSHIRKCYRAMAVADDRMLCFRNRYGGQISIQMVNRLLKGIGKRYSLDAKNLSTHSLRKTWARKVYENENAEGRGEMALLKLSELMNHSDPSITRRYIGLRQQELSEVYEGLKF